MVRAEIEGLEKPIVIDGYLRKALDLAIVRNYNKWDYVCIVSGIPGSGKSTLARTIGKYCSHWFNLSQVCFTDEEFIKVTNNCPKFSAVILDESFQSLNSRVTMSKAFLRIINHLQLVRQKHLFIILCLPNFFDLSKGIAVFRASHLFVTYASKTGQRGRFLGWGRDEKRRLYIRGMKYMNYNAQIANIRGTFSKNDMIMSQEEYERKKNKHLLAQEVALGKKLNKLDPFEAIAYNMKESGMKIKDICKIMGKKKTTIHDYINKYREKLPNLRFPAS